MHYNVFHATKPYVRLVDAASSFEARKCVAAACGADVTDFYAVRYDLMTDRDWKRLNDYEKRAAK